MHHAKRAFRLVLALALFAIALSACGVEPADMGGDAPSHTNNAGGGATETASGQPQADENEPEPSGEPEPSMESEQSGESERSGEPEPSGDTAANSLARALFADARQASEALDSFSVKMNLDQRFTFGGETHAIQSSIDVDAILKPNPIVRTKTTAGFGQEQFEITMIMTDQSLYMHEPFSDMWMEWPVDMATDMGGVTSMGQVNPLDQLDEIADYLDSFDVEETSDGYRMRMETSDSKFRGLLASQLAKQGEPGVLAELEESFEQLTVHRISYDFLLDKNHLIRELHMFMDFTVNVEGESTDMVMEVDATYYNHNNVADIPLPDNAMTLDDMGFGF